MTQKDFNTIIGQIEEDLKKLRSAKEQVENTVANNIKFAETTQRLMDSTKNLLDDVKNLTVDSLLKFTEQLTQTKTALDKLTSQTQESVKNSVLNFDSTSVSLTKTFSAKADEVAKAAKDTLEEQRSENLKVLNHILETHNNIKQLIGQLLDLKIPETLKNINTNLEKMNKDIVDFRKEGANIETNNQTRFKTTKNMQISTLAIVGVLGIVIVLKLFGVI